MNRWARRVAGWALVVGTAGPGAATHGQIFSAEYDVSGAAGLDLARRGELLVAGSSGDSGWLSRHRGDGWVDEAWDLVGDGVSVDLAGALFGDGDDVVVYGSADDKPWMAMLSLDLGTVHWQLTLGDLQGWVNRVRWGVGGDLLVVGSIQEDPFHADMDAIAARVGADGTLNMLRRYGDWLVFDIGTDVLPLEDGGMVLAAETDIGAARLTLTRLDAEDRTVWSYVYSSSLRLHSPVLTITPDDELVVAATGTDSDPEIRLALLRLDLAGEVLSAFEYETLHLEDHLVYFYAESIGATSDGGVIVTTSQPTYGSPNHTNVAALKIDANGVVQNHRGPNHPGNQRVVDARVTPDGGVIVLSSDEASTIRLDRLRSDGRLAGDCDPVAAYSHHREDLAPTREINVNGFVELDPDNFLVDLQLDPRTILRTEFCGVVNRVFASNFGYGLAGSGDFVPNLTGEDGYALGLGPVVSLHDCLGNGPGFLMLSFNALPTELFGGIVWLDFRGMMLFKVQAKGTPGVPGAGGFDLQVFEDLTSVSGSALLLQALMFDPGAPEGVSLSQALTLTVE